MERVTGVGGIFFRAREPAKLARWYTEHLGVDGYSEEQDVTWWQAEGPTVFAPFDEETDYFGRREQGTMINFRVDDLDAMLAQLREAGSTVDGRTEELPGTAASAGRPIRRATASSCGSRRPSRSSGVAERRYCVVRRL